jgi:nucleotide-binding universal stress UspA family protein
MGCYCKILVALDGSADAYAGLRHAAELAADQHARLVVMMVTPTPKHAVSVSGPVLIPDPESTYAQELRQAVNSLPSSISVESRLTNGKPARRILEVAEESCADLIVMGFHGHGRLHQAVAGSVSATVLRESTRPVLLVRACDPSPMPSPVLDEPAVGSAHANRAEGRAADRADDLRGDRARRL